MKKRIRPKDTEENPIDDLFDALDLFCSIDYRTESVLITRSSPPYIQKSTFFDYYGTSNFYNITPELAQKLKDGGFVTGTPKWGYTDHDECLITDFGRKEFFRLLEERIT